MIGEIKDITMELHKPVNEYSTIDYKKKISRKMQLLPADQWCLRRLVFIWMKIHEVTKKVNLIYFDIYCFFLNEC